VDARRARGVRGASLHEQLHVALRTGINAFPRQCGAPKVLLTTFPGEQHGVGLLMVEALLVPEGAQCISLGPQTPIEDIRRAALAHEGAGGGAVVLRRVPGAAGGRWLASLRRQLPPAVAIWAGGEMTRRIRKALPGVLLVSEIGGTLGALKAWRAQTAPPRRQASPRFALTALGSGTASRETGPRFACRLDTTPQSVGHQRRIRLIRIFKGICHENGDCQRLFDALFAMRACLALLEGA
jgi:hypothetical protein